MYKYQYLYSTFVFYSGIFVSACRAGGIDSSCIMHEDLWIDADDDRVHFGRMEQIFWRDVIVSKKKNWELNWMK